MPYPQMPGLKDDGRSFADALARILHWLDEQLPSLRAALNPPADDAAIDSAQADCETVFPPDLRALYRFADGENGDIGLFFGLPFLSLARLVDEWRSWIDVERESPILNDNSDGFFESMPPKAIQLRYTNRRWIPIAHDHGGNHLGVDLSPGPTGRVGQVINFGADEDAKFVIAPSLAAFLNWYADSLEAGNYRVTRDSGAEAYIDFTIAEPVNEHFLDAVRDMGMAAR